MRRPSSGDGLGLPPAAAGRDYGRLSREPTAAAIAQRAGSLPRHTSFGPSAPDVEVTPRLACDTSSTTRRFTASNYEDQEVQKPHTGMTIRLTPELLARFREPGPKPQIQLVLKNAGEGGPVLIVDGVPHNMNAHQMAIGSEVHIVARTIPSGSGGGGGGGDGEDREESPTAVAREDGEKTGKAKAGMSIFASLHRKLIVQQVLTETKRAEIRARNDEIDRREKEAKKKMVRMEDQDEMLAAAESIPVPVGKMPLQEFRQHGAGGEGGGGRGLSAARGAGAEGGGSEGGQDGRQRRDPLTAWVCNCYNNDDYAGHVSDSRKFLRGIDFHNVLFRYHVKPDGTLDPDRRRFCIKFKTKAGRDLAIKRSGEALGSYCSWWNPENVTVVVKGRDEDGNCGFGGSGGGGSGEGVNGLLLVLPHGRSVADVLEKVKARLPRDLTPAIAAKHRTEEGQDSKRHQRKRKRNYYQDDDDDDDNPYADGKRKQRQQQQPPLPQDRQHRQRYLLEAYRRDMLRAALGASLAEALALGPGRGAPAAAARSAGTDENNAWRVATLAWSHAATELDGVDSEALAGRGVRVEKGGGRNKKRKRVGGGRGLTMGVSGPAGGARAQRRLLLLQAEAGRRR